MTQFSVVVPTYNRASTLPRAVQSVLCQTFADFDLVIVDDGSTDETNAVIAQYDDDRIHFLRQPNRGVSAARNAGAAAARGRWIVFLDSDDELLPHALERFSRDGGACKLVVCGVTRISPDGLRRQTVVPDREQVVARRFSPLLAGGFAVRRDLFEAVGGYDEALAYSENTEFAWRFALVFAKTSPST